MWWLLACVTPSDDRVHYEDSDPADVETGGENLGDCGTCPCGMVGVGDPVAWCIDAYEDDLSSGELGNVDQGADFPDGSTTARPYTLPDVYPETLVSWYQAYALCQNAGKHLCSPTEWEDACDGRIGEGGAQFPWGESPTADQMCAAPHPDGSSAYDTLSLTGAFIGCRTPSGVFDQAGNAWEWVDPGDTDDQGSPVAAKVGGAYYAGEGNTRCASEVNTEHPPEFEGTIGFRCCALPKG